jgi:Phage integrase family
VASARDHALACLLILNGLRVSEACAAAGLAKHITPHSLPHTMVNLALDAGVSLRDVQDAARHADPRTTRRYDRVRHALDRHATYTLAAFLAEDVALPHREGQYSSRTCGVGCFPVLAGGMMGEEKQFPRALGDQEAAVLDWVLAHRFTDAGRLRAQAASAVATGRCACGCASIHLDVEHTSGLAARTPSPVPVQPQIVGDDGQPVGGVLLFLQDGWLSYLEVYSYGEPIPRFPSTDRLDLEPAGA